MGDRRRVLKDGTVIAPSETEPGLFDITWPDGITTGSFNERQVPLALALEAGHG